MLRVSLEDCKRHKWMTYRQRQRDQDWTIEVTTIFCHVTHVLISARSQAKDTRFLGSPESVVSTSVCAGSSSFLRSFFALLRAATTALAASWSASMERESAIGR